jgi:tetratricopeptide (TPR) repeat protein
MAARALRRDGQPEVALATLEPVLSLETPPAGALVLAAECVQLVELTDDGIELAEAYLRKALELDPDHADAQLELAHLLYTYRDEDSCEVQSTLDSARRKIEELDVSATLLQVFVRRDQGLYEQALDLVNTALLRHPNAQSLIDERNSLLQSGRSG